MRKTGARVRVADHSLAIVSKPAKPRTALRRQTQLSIARDNHANRLPCKRVNLLLPMEASIGPTPNASLQDQRVPLALMST